MKYYYTDAQNKPTGPVELEQLKQLHAQGTLTPQSSVIPEGATQWITLGAILAPPPVVPAPTPAPTPSPAAASTTPPATASVTPAPAAASTPAPAHVSPTKAAVNFIDLLGTSLGRFVETLLEFMRKVLTESFLNRVLTVLTRTGHTLVLIGAVLGLIYSVVLAIRANSFGFFGIGLGLVLWIAILQYAALRFFTANQALVKNSPSRLGSAALLDCLALILVVGAVVAFIGGTVTAIRTNEFGDFVGGVLAFCVLVLGAGAALHPQLSNIKMEASSAGEEAIGLASFFGKASLVMLPLLFACAALAGTIVIVVAFFSSDRYSGAAAFIQAVLALVPGFDRFGTMDPGLAGVGLLVQACLFPLFAYLGFLLLYLSLDLMRAVLEVPRKLDRLAR
jgi:hypothetical protein